LRKSGIILLLCANIIWAQTNNETVKAWPLNKMVHGNALVSQFDLESGKSITDLRLHYITLGKPKRNASNNIENAVMLLHATINDASFFLDPSIADVLFKKDAPLDLERFYIIIPDGIGAGHSTKPSDGLYGQFPAYGYLDQIRAQKEVLDKLGVDHLKLILGTSMGGMQTWLWGEQYPDSADNLVPIVSTPAPVSGRNFIWRKVIMQSIQDDNGWSQGNYGQKQAPNQWKNTAGPLNAIMLGTAKMLQGKASTQKAALDEYNKLVKTMNNFDASDLFFVFNSSYDYNPTPSLSKIKAQLLTINFADDLLNPPEFIHLPPATNIRGVMLEGGYGHMALAHPELWVDTLTTFLADKKGWAYLKKNPPAT